MPKITPDFAPICSCLFTVSIRKLYEVYTSAIRSLYGSYTEAIPILYGCYTENRFSIRNQNKIKVTFGQRYLGMDNQQHFRFMIFYFLKVLLLLNFN